jgi:hypothetical protein
MVTQRLHKWLVTMRLVRMVAAAMAPCPPSPWLGLPRAPCRLWPRHTERVPPRQHWHPHEQRLLPSIVLVVSAAAQSPALLSVVVLLLLVSLTMLGWEVVSLTLLRCGRCRHTFSWAVGRRRRRRWAGEAMQAAPHCLTCCARGTGVASMRASTPLYRNPVDGTCGTLSLLHSHLQVQA